VSLCVFVRRFTLLEAPVARQVRMHWWITAVTIWSWLHHNQAHGGVCFFISDSISPFQTGAYPAEVPFYCRTPVSEPIAGP
jgi:hypothetical protein